jgi:2-methylcitrate dehydratase PrpD
MEFMTGGAFTKRFHPGWAAHSGINAALLAQEGFTGPPTIVEGKWGFLEAYSPKSDARKVLEDWAKPYKVMRASIKPHSCCRYKQGPIDGILEIMNQNQLQALDIESVKLGILKTGMPLVVKPEEQKYNPKSVVDAQFSMPYGAAVAILYGKASLDEYTQEKIDAPEVKEMMRNIVCVEDLRLEKDFPRKWPASVKLKIKEGREFSADIEYPKGDPENPLSWEELIEKFRELVRSVYSEESVDQIVTNLRTLEEETDYSSFSMLLAGKI